MADNPQAFPHDPIEAIARNSFRNFHALGLDYLCLVRSPSVTIKAYFYDNPKAATPEVVCPHDHRYPFSTTVLAGQSGHIRYDVGRPDRFGGAHRYQRFAWRTPLNGGDGFIWAGEASLAPLCHENYVAGDSYWCRADEVHTITITRSDTILLLCQLADVVPLGHPTTTFVPGSDREPPNLTGLYDEMSEDHASKLLSRLAAAMLNERQNDEG